jgi:two-component system chemotaxis sensor kinase CheA
MKSSTSEKACRPLRVALKLRVGQVLFALVVDEMLEAQQIELKSLPTPLRTFAAFSGAGLLGNGSVVLGLDPSGLLNAIGASQHKLARGAEIRQQLTNIVLFRSYGSALRGFPASAVARIVQLGPAQIEIVDGERVFRANHRLIPLAGMESRSSQADPDARSFPTLLLEQDGGSLGLMVDEVVDVIEAEVIVDRAGLGSATLGGATIEVLDPLVFFSRSRKAKRAAILIVEPSGLVQKMLAELLSQNGYQASAVGDVGVALAALLEEERFAVALVDVGVAVAQASEISGRLKHAGVGSPPVLIGLASHGGPSMRAKAKTAGLSTAVGKFDRASLLSALHSTLGEAEMAA